jgi:hypothetical protein
MDLRVVGSVALAEDMVPVIKAKMVNEKKTRNVCVCVCVLF